MTYECKITILDVEIPTKTQKVLQKLKTALEKEYWASGNVHETTHEVEFFKKETLKQDLHVYYHYAGRMSIKVGGSEIDRDNLAMIEKILKRRADIEVIDGKLRLEFMFSMRDNTYSQFGRFENINDIPMNMELPSGSWKCEIHGYTRKGREYS